MTDALKQLAEKLEAEVTYSTMGHTRLCQKAFPPRFEGDHGKGSNAQLTINVWNKGSLDAAKTLHESVLPRWCWSIEDGVAAVWIEDDRMKMAKANESARAWLLAIIRALITEGDQK